MYCPKIPDKKVGDGYTITKREAMSFHAIKRAKQRYGVSMPIERLRLIEEKVRLGEQSLFIKRQSKSCSHFLTSDSGMIFRVVYNRKQKAIATFLPIFGVDVTINELNLSALSVGYPPLSHDKE